MKTIITTPNRFIVHQVYDYLRRIGTPADIVKIDNCNVIIKSNMINFLADDFKGSGFEMSLYKERQCIIKIIC